MKRTPFNTGKAVVDKYGYYRHLGHAMKNIDGATLWIGRTNPTAHYTEDKEFFKVYVIPDGRYSDPRDRTERSIIPEVRNGFKTIEQAKKWANQNIEGAAQAAAESEGSTNGKYICN